VLYKSLFLVKKNILRYYIYQYLGIFFYQKQVPVILIKQSILFKFREIKILLDLFNQIRKKLVIFVHFNISQKPKSYHVRFNICPIAVKTDVGQIDLVLWLSDGTSDKIRDSQMCRYDWHIYFHWYKILGLYAASLGQTLSHNVGSSNKGVLIADININFNNITPIVSRGIEIGSSFSKRGVGLLSHVSYVVGCFN
jgi:hypothetical protein